MNKTIKYFAINKPTRVKSMTGSNGLTRVDRFKPIFEKHILIISVL